MIPEEPTDTERNNGRILSEASSLDQNGCRSVPEIRKYLDDKVIVVYAAQSYVAQED